MKDHDNDHDEDRRAFLVGTVAAGALAGTALVPPAHAQHHPAPAASQPAAPAPHAHAGGYGAWLNDEDSLTIAAFAERLMPGRPGKPGARDAGVLNYIDLALAGA